MLTPLVSPVVLGGEPHVGQVSYPVVSRSCSDSTAKINIVEINPKTGLRVQRTYRYCDGRPDVLQPRCHLKSVGAWCAGRQWFEIWEGKVVHWHLVKFKWIYCIARDGEEPRRKLDMATKTIMNTTISNICSRIQHRLAAPQTSAI